MTICLALLCQVHNCAHHYQVLNRYYQQIIARLREAANVCVPCIKVGVEKHRWSPELDEFKDECIYGLLRYGVTMAVLVLHGSVNEIRLRTKLRYKCAIKDAILTSESKFNDNLVGHLSNKDFNSFWKSWRKRFFSKNLTPTDCLNSKSRAENVLAEFTSHF